MAGDIVSVSALVVLCILIVTVVIIIIIASVSQAFWLFVALAVR